MKPRHEYSSRYFVLSEHEVFSLAICVVLDVFEYMFAILLVPIVGDFLDVIGIIACFAMFRWIGIVSLFELVPGADIFPIFIVTWLIWYLVKKRKD